MILWFKIIFVICSQSFYRVTNILPASTWKSDVDPEELFLNFCLRISKFLLKLLECQKNWLLANPVFEIQIVPFLQQFKN